MGWDNAPLFGPPMCIVNVSSCKRLDLSSVFHQYCVDQFDVTKRPELEGILGACLWEKAPAPAIYLQGPTIGTYKNVFGSMEQCTDNDWRIFRLGPFVSTGGYNWMSVTTGTLPHKDWSEPGLVADVTRYFVGTVSAGGEIIGFPPVHVHHFHVEEETTNVFLSKGSLITHGDDECLQSAGGPACNIRSMPPGYATWMKVPFRTTFELNDVRPAGSEPLRLYGTIALRIASVHRPDESAFKPFTQTRLRMTPLDPDVGHVGTYQVPARLASVFYEEYEFTDDADLLWSYGHTHPFWVSEMFLFVNTTAALLRLTTAIGRGQQLRKGLSIPQIRELRHALASNGGSKLVCHWDRTQVPYEVLPGTLEIDSTFTRKGSCCRPFHIFHGLTAVGVVILAPWSNEAAHGDKNGLAAIHTFFRFFTSSKSIDTTALALNPTLIRPIGNSEGDFQDHAEWAKATDYANKFNDFVMRPFLNTLAEAPKDPLQYIKLQQSLSSYMTGPGLKSVAAALLDASG